MRRETLIAWGGKNEVEEELKEKAGEKGSKAARQRGTQAVRHSGVEAGRCPSDITWLCNFNFILVTTTTLNVIRHRAATTTERPRILRNSMNSTLPQFDAFLPPQYSIIYIYKSSISTLASIMSNYTTITALWWPAQPRLLISF